MRGLVNWPRRGSPYQTSWPACFCIRVNSGL